MSERTFSREAFIHARDQWRDGEFGPEWAFYRQVAADRGFIYPPAGSKWDSTEDDSPSQRAIVYRAMEDTPEALTAAVRQSWSWNEVVRKLMADVDRRREDAGLDEKQIAWDRQNEPNGRQAIQTVHEILQRIKDSAA